MALRDRLGLFPSRVDGNTSTDESGVIARYLSAPVEPGREFVDSLETRLMTEPVPAMSAVTVEPRSIALRPRFLKLALPASAMAAALAAVLFISLHDGQSTPPLHADVIRDSANNLYNLDTVRYSVSVESEKTICITVIGEVPTREVDGKTYYYRSDRKIFPPDQQTTYGCVGGQPGRHVEERGVYDLREQAFHAESRSTGKGISPVTDPDAFTSERMYIDGVFYARQAGGTWSEIPVESVWDPFTFGGEGSDRAAVGGLNHLMARYENIEIVGTEQIDGATVTHYRATRDFLVGEETVDAWIGLDDGLPRKATLVMIAREHEQPLYWGFPGAPGTELTMGELLLSPDAQVPSAASGSVLYTYTYEFSDFNEPVEIVAP